MANSGLIVFLALVTIPTATSTAPGADSAVPAATSGLIVFLPLVGAIAGGFVGAVATGLVRSYQDRKARNQERKGLLDLIGSELTYNISLIGTVKGQGDSAAGVIHNLRTDVWESVQVRLAQLLPKDELDMILYYYANIQMIKISPAAGGTPLTEEVEALNEAAQLHARIRGIIGRY
jgi:hypothetical protein